VTVVIEADPEIIRQRLENRGRESTMEIQQRIQRQPSIAVTATGYISIRNDGPLEEGGNALIAAFAASGPDSSKNL
jgi:ribose 1,5-bisphosphokinase